MRTPLFAAIAVALSLAAPRDTRAADPAALAAAVADCRGLNPDSPIEKQRRFGEAVKVLATAGEDGIKAMESELAKLRAAREGDVIFQATVAEVILGVRELNGIGAALEALRGVDAQKELRHLWPTLSAGAGSRDPRALPLLRLALATDEESAPATFPNHGMNVPWPYTLLFLYGAYGQGACADLLPLVARPPTPREDASLAFVLTQLDCPGAAAALRPWATGKDEERAVAALRALGELGDPADKEVFLACPARPEVLVRLACAFGLWELAVPATSPAIRQLLDDADERVRFEAAGAAFRLADEEGIAAVLRRRMSAKGEEAERIDAHLVQLAKGAGVEPAVFVGGDAAPVKKALAAYQARRGRAFERRAEDPALSRGDFEKRLARWEKEGRVEAAGEGELRAALAVARAEDLPAIHRARGRVLLRQSDECLHEVQWLDRLARVVHRRAIGSPRPNE